ncbi:MAG TPA: hypothetical protein VHT68_00055 [Pseudolabrys sp.]|jgi:hypothetical protein|nr:hypothetical protein [Pseudolabrys sp.]
MPLVEIPHIWMPSQENINKLPLALRKYIKALQNADPGLATSMYWMEDTLDAYKKEIDRLSALLREVGIDPTPTQA